MSDKDNVLQFPKKEILFSKQFKSDLEKGVSPYTDKPVDTIQTVENIVCNAIVASLRSLARSIGASLGDNVARAVTGGRKNAR